MHASPTNVHPAPGKRALPSGFTLVELLVVVLVIAVLAAMLLPALGATRDLALRTRCAAQQRQTIQAWLTYRDEYGGLYPMVYGTVTGSDLWWKWTYRPYAGRWQHTLDQYLENYEVFNCPSSKRALRAGASIESPPAGYTRGAAYGGGPGGWCTTLTAYNEQAWGRSSSNAGLWKGPMCDARVLGFLRASIPTANLARCPVFFDGLWRNDGTGSALPFPCRQKSPLDQYHQLYWIHRGRANMAFSDGHQEVVAYGDVASFEPLLLH